VTPLAWALLAGAGIFAAGDWFAVARKNKALEYICKPATLVALTGAAVALHPRNDAVRWAFVVALVLSIAGDVFLMLPSDAFVPGLASFFGAHVAYIVGFRLHDSSLRLLLVGAMAVFAFAVTIGRTVIASVRAKHPELVVPVSAYLGVISVMVACAIGTRVALAATGAVVFMISDSLIAWNRFVRPLPWAPVAIMVAYHVAQVALVLSLRF
jgi:uncharacterized membrane protein YhhN